MKRVKLLIFISFIFVGSIMFKMFYTSTSINSSIKYNIMIGGTKSATFPNTNAYTVNVSCTSGKGTVTWNPNLSTPAWEFKFENGYVNNNGNYTRSNITSNDSCDIVFTARTDSNKLSLYIKSLLNGGTSVSAGASGNTLQNLGTTAGTAISNGTTTYYHDIGIRYIGPNPNNYIKFNNELWRIIGVFREAKTSALSNSDTYYTKIIRNESMGGLAYNTVANTSVASNAYGWWSKSDGSVANTNYILNHYYMGADNNNYDGTSDTTNCRIYMYNGAAVTRNCDYRVIGIQPGWSDMVINTTWYTAAGVVISDASASFSGERGSTAGAAGGELSYKDTTTNKYSKVGLMYPSDYLYAGGNTGWLLQNGHEWIITPGASSANTAYEVNSDSNLISSGGATSGSVIRPTVYLSDSVYITGGTGTLLDPYTIAM